MENICFKCKKKFEVILKRQKYCSYKCRNDMYYEKIKNNVSFKRKQQRIMNKLIKNCIICQKEFKTSYARQKVCSIECLKIHHKNYKLENIKHIYEIRKINLNNRYYNEIEYKLGVAVRNRFKKALKNNSKKESIFYLIGCTIQELKEYLESQFKDGMSWENYNINGWHIDHKIPCSAFDLTKIEEQQKCFHYTNLQPLWAYDNRVKHDKILVEVQ